MAKRDLPLWGLLYIGCLALITWGMFTARRSAINTYGSESARVEWETWREDVRQLPQRQGPIRRDVPESELPPALVLMRDHFSACFVLAIVLSSALFFTMMIVTRGAFQTTVIRED